MVTRIGRRKAGHLYIKEWMDSKDLSDETVALRVGVDRVTVTRWRTHQDRLNPSKIAALAEAIGIEPEQLWRLPERPSVDALLKNQPDDVAQRAAAAISLLLKTGS